MFFNRFKELCEARGVTPTKAATDAGVNKSAVTYWRTHPESKPTGQSAEKLCAYFGITMSELYGDTPDVSQPINNDPDLTAYLEQMRTRPEMRMLFQHTKGASKEDVEKAVKIIETLLGK